jgi:hypothetical protein
MMEDVLVKLNPGLLYAAFKKKRALFKSKMDLELWKKLVKLYVWSILCMVLELGRFG